MRQSSAAKLSPVNLGGLEIGSGNGTENGPVSWFLCIFSCHQPSETFDMRNNISIS